MSRLLRSASARAAQGADCDEPLWAVAECPSPTSNHLHLEEQIFRRQMVRRCHEVCQRLSELEREVIMRLYFQHQEMSEVTATLGYSRCHISRTRLLAPSKIEHELRMESDLSGE